MAVANTRLTLSLLWVFATANYIYCDVFTQFHGPTVNQILTGTVNGVHITEWFLLGFAVILELPMAMIVGAWVLPHQINRIANLVVGAGMTLLQASTVFMGGVLPHYYFFSAIEVVTTALIFFIALRWREAGTSTGAEAAPQQPAGAE